MPLKIFISYRQRDTALAAKNISQIIQNKFKKDVEIFLDVDNIDLGFQINDVIAKALDECDVLIVVIGPNWLTVVDDQGNPRLESPRDYVRSEITRALRRSIDIISIGFDAALPTPQQLPRSIAKLAAFKGITIRSIALDRDVIELIQNLETRVNKKKLVSRKQAFGAGVKAIKRFTSTIEWLRPLDMLTSLSWPAFSIFIGILLLVWLFLPNKHWLPSFLGTLH